MKSFWYLLLALLVFNCFNVYPMQEKSSELIIYGDNKKISLDETTKVIELAKDTKEISSIIDNNNELLVVTITNLESENYLNHKYTLKQLSLDTKTIKTLVKDCSIITRMELINNNADIALISRESNLELYNIALGKSVIKLKNCDYLTKNNKNDSVATVKDNLVCICDFKTNKVKKIKNQSHDQHIHDPTYSPDGNYLAFTGENKNDRGILYLHIFGTKCYNAIYELAMKWGKNAPEFYRPLKQLTWSPDSKKLAFWFNDVIKIWDSKTNNIIKEIKGDKNSNILWKIAWSSDSTLITVPIEIANKKTYLSFINLASAEIIDSQLLHNAHDKSDAIKKIIWRDNQTIVATYNCLGLLQTFIPISVEILMKKNKQNGNTLSTLETILKKQILTDVVFA